MITYDTAVIGAGPAGIASSIQLARYGLKFIVFEMEQIGGLLKNANWVENYPGFPDGISGPELIDKFSDQFNKHNIELINEKVTALDFSDGTFQIQTGSKKYNSQSLIIATGTSPITINDIDIDKNILNRIFYEVYPLRDKKNKNIAIIGAGDAAFDYALNLSSNNDVLIINRSGQTKCLNLLRQRAKATNSIKYFENCSISSVKESSDSRIALSIDNDDSNTSMTVDYLLIAIGRKPNVNILAPGLIKMREKLESNKLLHFIGDTKNGRYRQTAIAVGDGVKAAMEIYDTLAEPNK